jgi:hypothetical protein
MHINLQPNKEIYTEAELLHIQECSQCNEDIYAFDLLQESSSQMPLMVPDELNWQAIKRSINTNEQVAVQPITKTTRSFLFQKIMGIAASTFFIAVGWLVWNNHQLQTQLEQVLMVNQSLELQLARDQIPTFRQAKLLNKVRIIEENLIYAQSQQEKLHLLKRRQKLVAEMVRYQGEEDEISI